MLAVFSVIILMWALLIKNVYKKVKNKSYKTNLPIIVCEVCALAIITTWFVQPVVISKDLSYNSIWIFVIVGIISIIHKRLKAPKYKLSK